MKSICPPVATYPIRLLWTVLLACIFFAGCTAAPPVQTEEPNTPAPSILLEGQAYYAPHMPVYDLPEGYEYAGTLSEEAANDTGLAGNKLYIDFTQVPLTDFYVYQYTGTPIGNNTVDTTRHQWLYVHWSLPDE